MPRLKYETSNRLALSWKKYSFDEDAMLAMYILHFYRRDKSQYVTKAIEYYKSQTYDTYKKNLDAHIQYAREHEQFSIIEEFCVVKNMLLSVNNDILSELREMTMDQRISLVTRAIISYTLSETPDRFNPITARIRKQL